MKRPESRVRALRGFFAICLFLLSTGSRKAAPMPLQHTQEHEEPPAPLATFSTSTVEETMPKAARPSALNAVSDAPRYDAANVKQIIALAEQMQSHHRQTLTPADIEALGHEVGVEPEFIRRALAQMAVPTAVPATSQHRQSPAVAEMRLEASPFPLTRRQRWLLAIPPALYFLLLPFTLGGINLGDYTNNSACLLLYLIVPAVMAFYLGGKDKSYRFAALVGAVTGLVSVVSAVLANITRYHYTPPPSEILTMLAMYIGVGVALGLFGATARNITRRKFSKSGHRSGQQTKRRLRVRVVVDNAD